MVDSCGFIKSYQRYLVAFLTWKATITKASNQTNTEFIFKIITKSLEFLSRKAYQNTNISKLIEDNFPYIFSYVTLNSVDNSIAEVFHYITDEIRLDIDKLVNYNKQRLFNELLSRCGNPKYKVKVFQAVCVLTASSSETAVAFVTNQLEDKCIIKSIEPGLLAALIHFDMCLMKSSINLKG